MPLQFFRLRNLDFKLPYPFLRPIRSNDQSEEPAQSPIEGSLGADKFFDGAGDIFSMYLKFAREEDKKMAEGWKEDADGILIFVGFRPPALCFTQLTVKS
jgi:hypothetical protein